MEQLKKTFKANIRQYGMIIAMVVLVIFFYFVTGAKFGKPMNVSNIIAQNGYVLVLAIGMLLVILTGNIDLAVGSVVAVIGTVAGIMMVRHNIGVVPTILVCLVCGLIIGIWQGFWIAVVHLPPFIATLAGMLIFRGLTLVLLQGVTIAPLPKSFSAISSGFLPDFIGIIFHHESKPQLTTLVLAVIGCLLVLRGELVSRRHKKAYGFEVSSVGMVALKVGLISAAILLVAWRLALYRGIPYVLLIVGALALIYNFILSKTTIGRHIYAWGGNAKAAELSGIKTSTIMWGVFINMSFLSAVAGIVFAARLNSASPQAGEGFEMDAIASCFLGGASATGGVGTITGALVGGLIMGILNNGMSLMGVSIDWQQVVKGMVVLLAVSFDMLSKSRSK